MNCDEASGDFVGEGSPLPPQSEREEKMVRGEAPRTFQRRDQGDPMGALQNGVRRQVELVEEHPAAVVEREGERSPAGRFRLHHGGGGGMR